METNISNRIVSNTVPITWGLTQLMDSVVTDDTSW